MSTVTIRVDEETKQQVTAIVEDLGLDISTAVRAYFRQIIRERRIPLTLACDVPNEETLQSVRESELILNNPREPRFTTADDMFASLGI